MSEAAALTDVLRVGIGDAVLVLHPDGTFHCYLQEGKPRGADEIALGLKWLLEDETWVAKLRGRVRSKVIDNG